MVDIFDECADDLESYQVKQSDLDNLFTEINVDQTGKISQDEFRTLLKKASGM